jgi:hypothetical protein
MVMETATFKLSMLLFSAVAVGGCLSGSLSSNASKDRQAFVEKCSFFRLSLVQQEKEIGFFPLDQQVDLYLLSPVLDHPGNPLLTDSLSRNGEAIIPVLVEQLNHEPEGIDRIRLLNIFTAMQRSGVYHVAADEALMSQLQHSVDSMRDSSQRGLAQEVLETIRMMTPRP